MGRKGKAPIGLHPEKHRLATLQTVFGEAEGGNTDGMQADDGKQFFIFCPVHTAHVVPKSREPVRPVWPLRGPQYGGIPEESSARASRQRHSNPI